MSERIFKTICQKTVLILLMSSVAIPSFAKPLNPKDSLIKPEVSIQSRGSDKNRRQQEELRRQRREQQERQQRERQREDQQRRQREDQQRRQREDQQRRQREDQQRRQREDQQRRQREDQQRRQREDQQRRQREDQQRRQREDQQRRQREREEQRHRERERNRDWQREHERQAERQRRWERRQRRSVRDPWTSPRPWVPAPLPPDGWINPTPWPEPTPEKRIFDCNWEITSLECVLMKFRWSKPHNEFLIPLQEPISTDQANFLTLQSLFTEGQKGKTGVAALSELTIEYSDGTIEDLMTIGRELFPEKISRNGQLIFHEEFDFIDIPLPSGKMIVSIFIKADSWIAPGVDAFISLELESFDEEKDIPKQVLP